MEALLGAVVGAFVAGCFTLGVALWNAKRSAAVRRADAQLALVREIMRHRGNQVLVVEPLNEVPLLFGNDEEVLRLYRLLVAGTQRDVALGALITRLAELTGLHASVSAADIGAFLHVQS